MSNCENCSSKDNCTNKENCEIEKVKLHKIKHIIGIMSGKGGVGKSTTTAIIAKKLSDKGYSVGILDADITGPSIPRFYNLQSKKAGGNELGILPVKTKEGIKIISMNLLIDEEENPVIWRGPAISSVVKQLWTDVYWGELDFLLIDMPPGTSDVALTVMQTIPLDGVIMVTTPQDMVAMIVTKAIRMAEKMKVNVIGLIENMSYIICPGCQEKIYLFSNRNIADNFDYNIIAQLPLCKELVDIPEDSQYNFSEDTEIILQEMINKLLESI